MGVLEKLAVGDYHVTLVSAETFTTFTPLLPCEYRLVPCQSAMLTTVYLLSRCRWYCIIPIPH